MLEIVLSTFPSNEIAEQVATSLVAEKLAACANIIPGLSSIFHWQGSIQTEQEVLAILKTETSFLPALKARLLELHPYEVPEFVTLSASAVSEAYQAWVISALTKTDTR